MSAVGQYSLFERAEEPPPSAAPAVPSWLDAIEDADGLRWYQRNGFDAIHKSFEEHRSVLVVMATGLGKTQLFGAVAANWPGKVLVLAHREELVEQARARLTEMTGEWVEVEQAELKASTKTRVVISTPQTLKGKRLERWAPDHFSLVIVDEAHHYVAKTFRKAIDYFTGAKVLGVTATPDRGDEKALGAIFEDVAYVFDIADGIEQGYLVPIRGRQVELTEINLEGVEMNGKDFRESQLDERMVHAVEGIVTKTLELEPDRQGIAFFPGVKTAELAAERFNARVPGSACMISGMTDKDVRKQIVKDFRAGKYRYLCNCQVATEGFDAPTTSLIIQGRPTKSRALYAQMVGRGTRVLPGTVEHDDGELYAAERRGAIAASGKPDLMILDFVGTSSEHALQTPEDLLGGRYTSAEVENAKKLKKSEPGANARELLEKSRAQLKALAIKLKSKVKAEVRDFDPFAVFHMKHDATHDAGWSQPPSERQFDALQRLGLADKEIDRMNKRDASRMLQAAAVRRDKGLASFKQLRQLQRFGVTDVNITFARASAALNYLQQKGWGRKGPVDPSAIDRIIYYREPGEDG